MGRLIHYKKIYEDLHRSISGGVYAPGELLPSENELCAKYKVARLTVRKSLDLLVSDDLIERRQGKGSIVKGRPKGIGILALSSTTTALDNPNLTTLILKKEYRRKWADAFTFPISEEEKAAGCIYFERLRLIDGDPVFYDITMLPNINLPKFSKLDLENKSLFDTLRSYYQIVVTGGVQQLFAIRADKRLKESFHVPVGCPILQLNRKIETNRSGFHIYSQVFCLTKHYGLIGTF